MIDESGTVRAISWRDLTPWLILVRVFRLAISSDVVALALLGALLTAAGWNVLNTCFLSEKSLLDNDLVQVRQQLEGWPGAVEFDFFKSTFSSPSGLGTAWKKNSVAMAFESVAFPFRKLFDQHLPRDQWFYFFVGGLWSIAVWALFGLAIARIAAVKFGRNEVVRAPEALGFAGQRWLACFGAPTLPLSGIFVLGIPMIILGLIMRLDFGVLIAGLVWLFVVLGGLVMAILGVGLLFSWPLMWGAVAAEGTDAFDAISRSYSYTFQKPLHYFFYAVAVCVLGFLGWCIAFLFIETLITFSATFVTWGCGTARWDAWVGATSENGSQFLNTGRVLIEFSHRLVRSLLTAYSYGFFWVSVSAVYLILRMQADQTEMDDIFIANEEHSIGLPAFDEDADGVPKVKPRPSST